MPKVPHQFSHPCHNCLIYFQLVFSTFLWLSSVLCHATSTTLLWMQDLPHYWHPFSRYTSWWFIPRYKISMPSNCTWGRPLCPIYNFLVVGHTSAVTQRVRFVCAKSPWLLTIVMSSDYNASTIVVRTITTIVLHHNVVTITPWYFAMAIEMIISSWFTYSNGAFP